jgi:hypothetical protein
MNKKEYLEFHEQCCKRMVEITRKKNADYTGTGDDPFSNFSRVESMGAATTYQGFLVRMLDKYSRIVSFSQRGFLLVPDESVEDTLLDLANYSILLAGYIKSEKSKERPMVGVDPVLRSFPNRDDLCIHARYNVFMEPSDQSYRCEGCGSKMLNK